MSSQDERPIPVILCGRTEEVGTPVIEGLKPEYEVVRYIMTPEAALEDIPLVLRGQNPPTVGNHLSTNNMAKPPVVVITGGGFTQHWEMVHAGVEKTMEPHGGSKVLWVRHDGTKPAPPIGPGYGAAMNVRVRETLASLMKEGKLENPGEGGVYWF